MSVYKTIGKMLEGASKLSIGHGLGVLLGMAVITIVVMLVGVVVVFSFVQIVFSIAAAVIAVV
jgi:hypothetical protein